MFGKFDVPKRIFPKSEVLIIDDNLDIASEFINLVVESFNLFWGSRIPL